jgi:hypothetical protein
MMGGGSMLDAFGPPRAVAGSSGKPGAGSSLRPGEARAASNTSKKEAEDKVELATKFAPDSGEQVMSRFLMHMHL